MQAINTRTSDAMANYVVAEILALSEKKLQAKQPFTLALAGGSTPALIYKKLSQHKFSMHHWILLYSDERFLPRDDENRNENLFKAAFGEIPKFIQHHPVLSADTATLIQAQQQYKQLISNIAAIDICLLGMGEDGHSASLFPHNIQENINSDEPIISIQNSTKAPMQRHSFNYSLINKCVNVILLASGASKAPALQQALSEQSKKLPIAYILQPATSLTNHRVLLLADDDACLGLNGFSALEQ